MTLDDVRKAKEALQRLPIEWDDATYDVVNSFIQKAEMYVLRRDRIPMLLAKR